jgi:hypothetical protein
MSQLEIFLVSSGSTESQHRQTSKGVAGFDQLSQTSGVVAAIISSPRGARASIDVERRGIALRALGMGAGVSILDATDLVSSKGNLMDGRELAFDSALIDFSEVWPSTSTVAADDAQLTRSPLEGLTERLDFLGEGLSFTEGVEVRFGDLSVEVVDEKLDFLFFGTSRIGGGVNFS